MDEPLRAKLFPASASFKRSFSPFRKKSSLTLELLIAPGRKCCQPYVERQRILSSLLIGVPRIPAHINCLWFLFTLWLIGDGPWFRSIAFNQWSCSLQWCSSETFFNSMWWNTSRLISRATRDFSSIFTVRLSRIIIPVGCGKLQGKSVL